MQILNKWMFWFYSLINEHIIFWIFSTHRSPKRFGKSFFIRHLSNLFQILQIPLTLKTHQFPWQLSLQLSVRCLPPARRHPRHFRRRETVDRWSVVSKDRQFHPARVKIYMQIQIPTVPPSALLNIWAQIPTSISLTWKPCFLPQKVQLLVLIYRQVLPTTQITKRRRFLSRQRNRRLQQNHQNRQKRRLWRSIHGVRFCCCCRCRCCCFCCCYYCCCRC